MFITTQKSLAVLVKRSDGHLSRVFNKQETPSIELAQELSKITGIPALLLITGKKTAIQKKLKKFFELQKAMRLLSLDRQTDKEA